MVSGIVQAPRIDLTNEELIRSHINATVLTLLNAEEFKPSVIDLIDIAGRTCTNLKVILKKNIKISLTTILADPFSYKKRGEKHSSF